MYTFKKIMIAVDLSAMDKYLLTYINGLCELIKPSKVYILNIQKNLDLDDDEKTLLGYANNQPVDEYVQSKINDNLESYFSFKDKVELEIEVVEGKPAEEVLHWADLKKIDLLVMGRKATLTGQGIMPQEIASKVKCSILLVPENVAKFSLKNIFVPINFSDETKLALEEAISIQKEMTQVLDINCHYVFELPLGHEKSGKTDEEFAEILNINAAKKFKKLKLELGNEAAPLDYSTELLKNGNIAKALNGKALELKSDLIIMGAKCKTLAAQLFLGNTTKKMIISTSTIPLLIVKEKNETFGFWDFFNKL